MVMKDETEEKHPSYALVSFSRRTGHPGRLFGSAIENHNSYITLAITRATRITRNGEDRYYGSMRGELIEVDLSASQFAELLTTMNVGLGIPCTLRYFDTVQVEPPPPFAGEVVNIRSEFALKLKEYAKAFKEGNKKVEGILEKKGALTRADKESILSVLRITDNLLTDITPHLFTLFQEATERVVTQAKSEIDSFMTHNIISEGIRSLMNKASDMIPQLKAGEKDE